MEKLCADGVYNNIVRTLKSLPLQNQEQALQRVPEDKRQYIQSMLKKHSCTGYNGQNCDFLCGPRGYRVKVIDNVCVFCDPHRLVLMCVNGRGRKVLVGKLGKMTQTARQKAMQRIPVLYRNKLAAMVLEQHMPMGLAQGQPVQDCHQGQLDMNQ